MKTIAVKSITDQINRCYLEYDPRWPENLRTETINSFKYYIEHTAGLKLDYRPAINKYGRFGYEIESVEIVDDKKYIMFLVKYS